MGLGIPPPATIIVSDVNVHNYDGTSGVKSESQSLSVTLAPEDKALLGGGGTPTNIYSEQLAVPASASIDVFSYTVPVGKTLYLRHATGSGDNKAVYVVNVDGTPIAKKRSYYTDFNVDFFFESEDAGGVVLNAGQVLTVNVTNQSGTPADFNAGAYGRLI